jgi:hypothetical protein
VVLRVHTSRTPGTTKDASHPWVLSENVDYLNFPLTYGQCTK